MFAALRGCRFDPAAHTSVGVGKNTIEPVCDAATPADAGTDDRHPMGLAIAPPIAMNVERDG